MQPACPRLFQDRVPADMTNIDFNDDSGAEDEEEASGQNNGGEDAWGSGGDPVVAPAPVKVEWTEGAESGGGGNW